VRYLACFCLFLLACSSSDEWPAATVRTSGRAPGDVPAHSCSYTTRDGADGSWSVTGDMATSEVAIVCNNQVAALNLGSDCRDCALDGSGAIVKPASEAWICECVSTPFPPGKKVTAYGTYMGSNAKVGGNACWARADERIEQAGLIPRCHYMAECIQVADSSRRRHILQGDCPDSP